MSLKISSSFQNSLISLSTSKPLICVSLLELACTLSGMGLRFAPPSLQPPNQLSPDQCSAQPSTASQGWAKEKLQKGNSCHLFYLEPDPYLTMQPGTEEDRPTYDQI